MTYRCDVSKVVLECDGKTFDVSGFADDELQKPLGITPYDIQMRRNTMIDKVFADIAEVSTCSMFRQVSAQVFNNGKPLQCLQCGASCGPNGELPPCNHGE